jgi:DNA repair protein RadC
MEKFVALILYKCIMLLTGGKVMGSQNTEIHAGRRERLRKRFIVERLEAFEPHEVLELLLSYAIPRKDTNAIAHALLKKYGRLSEIFEADVCELADTPGIGEYAAVLLSLVPQLSRRYASDRWGDRPCIDSSVKAGEFARNLLVGYVYEVFYVISLNTRNLVNNASMVQEGTVNEARVYPRLVVETALRHKAVNIILAHNHPGGSLVASSADIELTKRIGQALSSISINVVDHIIVAGNGYYSFAENRLIGE